MAERAPTMETWRADAARMQDERDALANVITRADDGMREPLAAHLDAMIPVVDALDGLIAAATEELVGSPLMIELDAAVMGDMLEWAHTFLTEARALAEAPDDDDDGELVRKLTDLAQLEREELLAPAAHAAQDLRGMSHEPRVARRLDRLAVTLAPPTFRRAA